MGFILVATRNNRMLSSSKAEIVLGSAFRRTFDTLEAAEERVDEIYNACLDWPPVTIEIRKIGNGVIRAPTGEK